ncbi:MAG TPA: hypothetical protein VGX22_03550, partial [Candidatus Dormibacteraeota bacterium]|nr:hypothetical protein [Candidatus Dormibacteraeota bacterium]
AAPAPEPELKLVEPAAATEAAAPNGEAKPAKKDRKRPIVLSDTEPVAVTDSEEKPEETPAET